MKSLRIAVAEDESFMRKYLETVLPRLGHEVVVVAATGRELVEQCEAAMPDLVITDVNMPEMDGLQAAAAIYAVRPTPIIVISGYHGPEVIERTVPAHVLAFLVKPIKHRDLELAIALALSRFERIRSLQESSKSCDAVHRQATIDEALSALEQWAGEGPDDALRHMQRLAADQQAPLVEIAQMILAVTDAHRAAKRDGLAGKDGEAS